MRNISTIIFLLICHFVSGQTTITLECDKDNTIYAESGSTSNATGVNLFAGVTSGNNKRRSLLHFTTTTIPAGANITSVSLQLNCNNVAPQSGNAGINIYRMSSDWGEATSGNNPNGMGSPATTNDATWTHRFFGNTTWTSLGGDYNSTSSGSVAIPQTGAVLISNGGLIADVQNWVNNTSDNFGWMITGNTEGTAGSARRFASRNNTTQSLRPKLTITYTNPLPVTLKSFSAILQSNKVVLNWITASESNNSHFDIEQSIDGRNFAMVGSIPGAGNSTTEKGYSFLHGNINNGIHYYRLGQVDFDGSKKYSSIVSINNNIGVTLKVGPNPVQSMLVLQANNFIPGKQFYITNASGIMVQKGVISNNKIAVGSLSRGVYFLNVSDEAGKTLSVKFIKQ